MLNKNQVTFKLTLYYIIVFYPRILVNTLKVFINSVIQLYLHWTNMYNITLRPRGAYVCVSYGILCSLQTQCHLKCNYIVNLTKKWRKKNGSRILERSGSKKTTRHNKMYTRKKKISLSTCYYYIILSSHNIIVVYQKCIDRSSNNNRW